MKGLETEGALVGGFFFDAWLGGDDVEVVEFFGAQAQEGPQDKPCMGGTEAEVRAEAEAEVGIGFAIEMDLIGRREGLRIEVGGGPAKGDARLCGYGGIGDRGFVRADATDMSEGHENAKQFFGSMDDAAGVFAEPGEGWWIFGEVVHGAGDHVDDGVASTGEGEVAKTEFFFEGEGAALVAGGVEGGEKVVTGMGDCMGEAFA